MNEAQVAGDFAAFTAPPPEVMAAQRKAKEKEERTKQITPKHIEAAEKLSESVKAQREAEEKALLIRQLLDYIKLMKEYHPERVEFLRVPKTIGVKNTCEELRIWIDDIKVELGKKSGLDHAKMLWVEGSRLFEKLNDNQRFGLNVQGLTQAATNSVLPRRLETGEIIPGPAVPTLAEFAVEHSRWFQSSVDWRMMMMAVEMVMAVHRANSAINVPKAAEQKVSAETENLMNEL